MNLSSGRCCLRADAALRPDQRLPAAQLLEPEVVALPEDPETVTLRCLMTGLVPHTRYYYAVQPSPAAAHPVASFVSPPLAGAQFNEYPLRILAFGDVDWTDGHPGDPVGSNPLDVGNSRRECT